jgi:glycosyltransferase involved in cell wall biosynthesis
MAQRLLPKAVASALAQTHAPLEVLIVENYSPDGTVEVARELAAMCPSQVRLLREWKRGAAAARNRGMREARGEWLAFLDADDSWTPDKLSRQLRAASGTPAAIIHCLTGTPGSDGGMIPTRACLPPPGNWQENFLARRFAVCTSTVMLRRRAALEAGGFDASLRLAEDTDLWLRVAQRGTVVCVPEALAVCSRGHPESTLQREGMLRTHASDLRVWLRRRGSLSGAALRAWREGYAQLFQLLALELARRGRRGEAIIRYLAGCLVRPRAALSPAGRMLLELLVGQDRWAALKARLR